MRILVVGNGAREDALSWRLAAVAVVRSDLRRARQRRDGVARTELGHPGDQCGSGWWIVASARAMDLVVLGPETAIAAGVGDRLRDAGLSVFGPGRSAGGSNRARCSPSASWSVTACRRRARPSCIRSREARGTRWKKWKGGGVVVKADGLAAGKGVVVGTTSAKSARVLDGVVFEGNAIPGGGSDVLLEERLDGREVQRLCVCDGRAMVPIAAACDYKRAGDGDGGPNTGGMGAYSPPAGFPTICSTRVRERILAPTLRGLRAESEE